MVKRIFFLIFLGAISYTLSQVQNSKIFEKKYDEIPIKVRIDNSGIYGISSFDVSANEICLTSFDDSQSYSYNQNEFIKISHMYNVIKDFTLDFSVEQEKFFREDLYSTPNNKITFKKSYLQNNSSLFIDKGGILSNKNGDRITITVVNRSELKIDFEILNTQSLPNGFSNHISLDFPNNLGCADFIGIDKKGNIFLLIETYITDIPLRVQREVFTISPNGYILSILSIPPIKCLYTIRDFQIDEDGNLYHLLCDKKKVSILKWSGLTSKYQNKISYPEEYNYSLHFNDLVNTIEIQAEKIKYKETLASRVEALRIGESYVLYKYSCNSSNLAPSGVAAPDGDTVKTPGWLITGYNARIPYKWGGFSSLTSFSNGLAVGKYAGDIDTDGSSSYAVGVDCSGFVSRCWQMTYHASTSYMPSITTQYSTWDSLKPADAIHKIGHVRLFIDRTSNGSFRVVESAGRNWDVSYWTFSLSDLVDYTPRYYNNMTSDFSKQQPELISALVEPSGKTKLVWTCDTTNVKGYRLYVSTDGEIWTMLLNENSLQTTSALVNRGDNAIYYRVSSVLNNNPTFSESSWSNVLGIGDYLSRKRVLIVDGFERKTGSWRGNQHTFILRYGKALQPFALDFESVKSNLVKDNLINLRDYEMVIWMSGDESTENETFSTSEQNQIRNYLENGGRFFVSGSEIGWDLYERGNSSDRAFYNQYLKASYISDNASSNIAVGLSNSCFNGLNFNFGQTYYEDYPDEISSFGGSELCMKYSNNKGAGIAYIGNFGSSSNIGKLIYLAFPIETTANDSIFNIAILNSIKYFYAGRVKLIVEGLFNSISNKLSRRDTVKAYLRKLTPSHSIIDSAISVIDSTTFTCNFDFTHTQTGDYYLVLKHHNSIETWSKNTGASFIKGISLNYDFTSANSQAYGNNMKMTNGKWCIYSGDVNQDGVIDLSDVSMVDTDNLNFITGYLVTDINGDGIVDLSDLSIADINNLNFISIITPLSVTLYRNK